MSFLIEMSSKGVRNSFSGQSTLVDNEDICIFLWGYILPVHESELLNVSLNNYKNVLAGIDGEFSLSIHFKSVDRLIIANGFTGQLPVYYTQDKNGYVVSNSIEALRSCVGGAKLSVEASFQMIQYGYLLENMTPLEGVFKLFKREYLELDLTQRKLTVSEFSEVETPTVTCENSAIELVQSSFMNSLDNLAELINKKEFSPVFTLSGGLDSRVVTLEMNNLLPYSLKTLCFGKKGCLDMKIADEIASKFGFEHTFYELEAGDYLYNFERSWSENNGFVYFSGASHTSSAINSINMDKNHILVTGQLGDAVLGSYLGSVKEAPAVDNGLGRFAYSKEPTFYSYKPKYSYKSMEDYLIFNRGFNGINNGVVTINNYAHHFSPFLTKDFLNSVLSIAPHIRTKLSFYLKWIEKYHEPSTRFKWERYELFPVLRNKFLIESKYYTMFLSAKRKLVNSGMISFDNEFKSEQASTVFNWEAALECLNDPELKSTITALKGKHGMLMDLKIYTVLFNSIKYGS